MSPARPAAVVVLAAGEGTRMKSSIPKVLHPVGGRSLVHHAVAAAAEVDPEHLVVVVGHGREQVTAHLAEVAPKAATAVQEEQLGTGHAVSCALQELPRLTGTVVVTYGDTPLLTGETLRHLVDEHDASGNAVTIITADFDDPTGYGRVLHDADGRILGVVEQKDATAEQRQIREVNSGIYAFEVATLTDALGRLGTDNVQGELYLTDVVGIASSDGKQVGALHIDDTWQTQGINDRVQLADVHHELNRRTVERWMRDGVTVRDPQTTWIDADVTLARDVTLEPNTLLRGATTVAQAALIGPNTELVDTEVGARAEISNTTSYGAVIGPDATVGPYTYLRPGTRLGAHARAGGFVEMKKAVLGEGAKVPHLSYVGDADIGAGANIGAGTIFANYDGVTKSHTAVGEHSFVGSNSVLVAPVEIADGAYVAAGSAITNRVEAGELAVARGKQRNIRGWVARRRAGTRTAAAAERADATTDTAPDESREHSSEQHDHGQGDSKGPDA
ncbi:MAG: bifunctional UDP-N-acetylglucosamine pyrophosphorylase / glucosamine-phosphate N-acetyltransferase [Actinomycetota bacterium]|nr:bifunctional UDP-N-acetylglucosamine pyrophosphorylase / glucosamine-phosphate N-acetyltransferase [Actinomycetota bacterium]